jgi:hypothetical protein
MEDDGDHESLALQIWHQLPEYPLNTMINEHHKYVIDYD